MYHNPGYDHDLSVECSVIYILCDGLCHFYLLNLWRSLFILYIQIQKEWKSTKTQFYRFIFFIPLFKRNKSMICNQFNASTLPFQVNNFPLTLRTFEKFALA